MFAMSKFWERFFYALTYISQGSSYLSPRAYAVLHRMHHAFSDTERDPHSPHHTKNIFTMMWKTKDIYNAVLHRKQVVERQFDRNYPEWSFIEKVGDSWFSRAGWAVVYSLFYIFAFVYLDMHWAFFFLLPVHFVMGPVHGAIINWYAHRYGYTNFKLDDTARNLLPFDFLMMGESYHNNHHKFGGRPNFGGFRWHEFDPAYPLIRLLDKVGILKLRLGRDEAYM